MSVLAARPSLAIHRAWWCAAAVLLCYARPLAERLASQRVRVARCRLHACLLCARTWVARMLWHPPKALQKLLHRALTAALEAMAMLRRLLFPAERRLNAWSFGFLD